MIYHDKMNRHGESCPYKSDKKEVTQSKNNKFFAKRNICCNFAIVFTANVINHYCR